MFKTIKSFFKDLSQIVKFKSRSVKNNKNLKTIKEVEILPDNKEDFKDIDELRIKSVSRIIQYTSYQMKYLGKGERNHRLLVDTIRKENKLKNSPK